MTITEALAELKTIAKRVEKKRETIGAYLMRQEAFKDPLEKDGGSAVMIQRERQAITDLGARHVAIRMAIQRANQVTPITVEGETKMLAEWLTWRKEIAPSLQSHIRTLRAAIDNVRKQALQKGAAVLNAGAEAKPADVLVNIDEAALATEAERVEAILGGLDGQLSLKNATVLLDV